MAEFIKNEIQLVNPNQQVLLDTSIRCNRGYLYHRPGSGIVTLRGVVNNPSCCFARYQCTFNANIALTEGSTVGPIAVALAITGEPILTSRAIVTPAAVDQYFNVTSTAIVDIPKCCCENISVENVSEPATVGGVAPQINVQNANLVITRIA